MKPKNTHNLSLQIWHNSLLIHQLDNIFLTNFYSRYTKKAEQQQNTSYFDDNFTAHLEFRFRNKKQQKKKNWEKGWKMST